MREDKINKENYKEKYLEEMISQEESKKFSGWLMIGILSIATIVIWIFGKQDLWSIKDKLILTGIAIFMGFIMGFLKIKEANKNIIELEAKRHG